MPYRATTWSEYKKYFEKDPALARRFQPVKLEEPSPEDAVTIIRGLRSRYEEAHGVYVRDDAVEAAARLAARYVSGRQLPDKAVDVLDTAAARVKISVTAKPDALDDRERRLQTLERERDAIRRDVESGVRQASGTSCASPGWMHWSGLPPSCNGPEGRAPPVCRGNKIMHCTAWCTTVAPAL